MNKLIVFEDKSLDPAKIGGIQGHGGYGSKEYDLHLIRTLLAGKIVRVYWSTEGHQLSSNFGWVTSLCIKGKLEDMKSFFRVLIDDDNYCYFDFDDILTVAIRKEKTHSISLRSNKNF